ncbi:MAG: cysteine hydrolase [Proteobacteria bacterium]|nr:cysteine hydrolase [Pseudomonadota bacterium]
MVIHVYAELTDLSGSAHSRGLVSERETVAKLCRAGTWGAEIVEELSPRPGEQLVPKQRYSAFIDTRMGTLLRANGIRTVVVTGTAAQTCVDSTVRDAQMNDYRVVVPQEGVCSRGKHQHLRAASLETLGLYFAEVVSAKQILGAWAALKVESAAD